MRAGMMAREGLTLTPAVTRRETRAYGIHARQKAPIMTPIRIITWTSARLTTWDCCPEAFSIKFQLILQRDRGGVLGLGREGRAFSAMPHLTYPLECSDDGKRRECDDEERNEETHHEQEDDVGFRHLVIRFPIDGATEGGKNVESGINIILFGTQPHP